MTLQLLRIINLSLLLMFVGLNIAIWKHHYETLSRLVIIGRSMLAIVVLISLSSRLLGWPQPVTNISFNILLFISMIVYIIGLLQFYKGEQIRDSTK